MSTESKIEALLFWKGEPVKINDIAKILELESSVIEESISKLATDLNGRGITVVRNGDEVMLYTSPEHGELIKKITKEELDRDISKAAAEVLAMIVYQGPISKRDIDHVRGVNSSYIIRNLMVRGLVERSETKDARTFSYQPTFELLANLGISKREDLPDYEKIKLELANFLASEGQANIEKNG